MYDKVTKNDIRKMQEEIDYRIVTVRPKVIADVKEARSFGDLSENFEYQAAKKAQRRNESRIRYLKKMIDTAHTIDQDTAAGVIGVDDFVTIYYPDDHEEETIKIVTTVRANSEKGRISIEAPLGKALLGHKENDTVSVQVNDTVSYDIIIRKIERREDDGTDEMLKY